MQTENGFKAAGYQVISTHYDGKTYGLENLRLWHQINEDDLLSLLNGQAVYPTLDSRRILKSLIPAPSADARRAEEQLRELVDEWIDSAVDENGDECPASRSLKAQEVTPAKLAIWNYSQTLRMTVDQNGSVILSGAQPRLPFTPEQGLYGLTSGDESAWLNHQQSAQAYFVSMMLSPIARRIAKCRTSGCGKYFPIGQPNHRYIGGTHCVIHSVKHDGEDSKKLNAQRRRRARERLHEACAKTFGAELRKPDWRQNRSLLLRMIETLNMRIAVDPELRSVYPRGLKAAWFARKENIDGLSAALILNGDPNA